MAGKLTLIVGPMYSGKTSALLSLVEIYALGKKNYVVFKPEIDRRYSSEYVVSHSGMKTSALVVGSSESLHARMRELDGEKVQAVFVDEVHFLDEGIVDVAKGIIDQGIDVFCVGLDMSYRQKPFVVTAKLMAVADEIVKKRAVCHNCGEYNAVLSYRTTNDIEGDIDVGGMEKYVAVCRDCYKILSSKKTVHPQQAD